MRIDSDFQRAEIENNLVIWSRVYKKLGAFLVKAFPAAELEANLLSEALIEVIRFGSSRDMAELSEMERREAARRSSITTEGLQKLHAEYDELTAELATVEAGFGKLPPELRDTMGPVMIRTIRDKLAMLQNEIEHFEMHLLEGAQPLIVVPGHLS